MSLGKTMKGYAGIRSFLGRLPLRSMAQVLFLLWAFLTAYQFREFVLSLALRTNSPLSYRPPSVEAFLPISSLMSLTYLVKTGVANRVHPAGLVIFGLTLLSSLTLRNGFCSWVCPLGTLSEYLYKMGGKIFGRNFALPKWPDRVLRAVKYILLAFFLFIILSMPVRALEVFLRGPYNRMADVKMYLFFSQVSLLALTVLVLLAVLSLFIKNFWCRYGCPYGALLGLLSRFSPLGIRREADRCLQCRRCDQSCPNSIRVSEKTMVRSEECRVCYSCLEACPKPDVLCFGSR
ncbi:MAG: 4Fe-4S binding protein, partial [Thermodesulfobacteriota bacterium]